VFTVINLAVIVCIIGIGIFYADITNWTQSPGGFFPFGFTGVSITSPPPGRRDKYCDEYVCLFLYLSTHISQKPRGRTSPNFLRVLHVAVARSFSDCIAISTNTSGFVDNVIFSHDVKWSVMRILKRREGNSQNYFIDSIPTKFCSTI